jgi:lysozyme
MNRSEIYRQLVNDEGVRLDAYLDTLGILTVGVGHKVLSVDDLKLGDTISEQQCEWFFNTDLDSAIAECKKLVPIFDELPEAAQEVLVNMCFNMGAKKLSKFHKFLGALQADDYLAAADEMKDSAWYGEVGARAKRLCNQIASLDNQQQETNSEVIV